MHCFARLTCLICFVICCRPGPTHAATGQATAAEPATVEVHLASGRTFRGHVDPRTDDGQLWLRFTRGDMTILRPIQWSRIAGVAQAEQTWTAAEFRPIADMLKSRTPRAVLKSGPSAAELRSAIGLGDPSRPLPVDDRVTQVQIDAYVANWDVDVETDGIVVHVFPLSQQGLVLPVSGTLEATLVGQNSSLVNQGAIFPRLARWVEQVLPEHLGPAGAIYRLPFQAVHPDFNFEVAAKGLLHVRLIVPGQGTFESSVATLRIRPYSSVRDRRQQAHGERFFPVERTGRW